MGYFSVSSLRYCMAVYRHPSFGTRRYISS